MVWWLRLWASTARGTGLIPGQGSSTCYAVWPKKERIYSGISRGKAELRPKEILEVFWIGVGTGFLRKGEMNGAPW